MANRDMKAAAQRVADMSQEEIMTFAIHDPGIFRDVARAYLTAIKPYPVEFFGGDDDRNCILKPTKD